MKLLLQPGKLHLCLLSPCARVMLDLRTCRREKKWCDVLSLWLDIFDDYDVVISISVVDDKA